MSAPSSLAFRPATELLSLLRARQITSAELTRLYLGRIAAHNPRINAVVALNPRAEEDAAKCDAVLDGGEGGPLCGLPVTVKDCWATTGLRTAAGVKAMGGHVPEEDALVVKRLKDAGAVILGKTNVPPKITGEETSNSLYGRTSNPYDVSRTPGGSSGGAAAALASGLSGLDVGSDSGGSLRQPAHCCGLFAHVPTHGLVPLRGHLPKFGTEMVGRDSDLVAAGPIARSAADLAIALRVLAGPDPEHEPHVRYELPGDGRKEVRGFRIGAWLEDEAVPTDGPVLRVLEAFVRKLKEAGAKVDVQARPGFGFAAARDLAFMLWCASSSDATPQAKLAELATLAKKDPGSHPPLTVLRARAEHLRHGAWQDLDARRLADFASAFADFFESHDVLLCPIIPVLAPHHDPASETVASLDHRLGLTLQGEDGHRRAYLDQIAWPTIAGMCGLPSVAMPAGRDPATGMPVGVQAVARRGGDATALAFAAAVERSCGGFEPPDGFE